MSKIPYSSRRNGRYYFRRRARWQNVGDYVAIIPLATCSAQNARFRSISMAGRFEELKGEVTTMIGAGTVIDQEQIQQLFDNELRHTLDRLLTEYHGTQHPERLVDFHTTLAANSSKCCRQTEHLMVRSGRPLLRHCRNARRSDHPGRLHAHR